MAALEIPGNGDTGNHISEENIFKTLDTLEDPLQKVHVCPEICCTFYWFCDQCGLWEKVHKFDSVFNFCW